MGGTPLSLNNVSDYKYCAVGRITRAGAAEAVPAVAGVTAWDDEDEEIEVDENFYGLPIEGQYVGRKSFGKWIFDKLTQFMDYLSGMIFSVIKIEVIGWVRILENGITDIINTITQTQTTSDIDSAESTELSEENKKLSTDESVDIGKINNIDENDVITIEDIIYNRVPVLDVNVFSFDKAGGMELEENSIIYKLRETIAQWYGIFRRIAIIVMLGMLIYIGIRMALSSVAEKKANYKRALTAWLTGFILIFFVHYIMIFVLNVNSRLVDIFNDIITNATESESVEGTIYDTMLTRAYSLPLSIGLPGTVMYVVLVYYMIKFLFIYIKRYIVVNILTLMAPVMVLKYTFESAGTGKKSNAISTWLSDYVLNVLIELIHAILYSAFMILALNLSSESLVGFIIALVIMNFISKADKILMKIFNFGKGKSTKDVNEDKKMKETLEGIFVAQAVAKRTVGVAKKAVKLPVNVAKSLGNYSLDVADILSEKDSRQIIGDKYHKAELGVQGLVTEKVLKGKSDSLNNLLEAKRALYLNGGSGEDERIKKTLETRKALKRKMRKDSFRYGKTVLGNAGMMIVSIPMMITEPKVGFASANKAFQNIRNSSRQIEGYIPTKHKYYPNNKAARALLNAATLGMAGTTVNALEQARKDKDKIENELPADASTLAKAGSVEKDIDKLYKELTEGESETDEELDQLFHDITQDQVDITAVKNEIDNYMFETNVEEVSPEDVSSIMRRVERLYDKELDADFKLKLESAVKSEFNKRITSEKQTLSAEEAVEAIKESVATTHSTDISQLDKKQQQIASKIEELNRLEMETTQNRGKQIVNAEKIVNNIQKKNRKD